MKKKLLEMAPAIVIGIVGLGFWGYKKLTKPEEPKMVYPNIIILLADDLGYADLSIYGGDAHTPSLDSLAHSGIRFTDFYAAAPNCSPSRAGLMTGIDPNILGVYNYLPPGHPMHLRTDVLSLARLVKKRDYATAHFGKWHLSCLPQNEKLNQPQPLGQGFDYSFGTENNAYPSHLNPVNFVRNRLTLKEQKGFSCDILVRDALNWLDDIEEENPYFLYMAFHEPHKKVASPPDLVSKYAKEYDKQDAEYLANVENMDKAIGRLLKGLREKGMDKNTFILFSSDNGSYRKGSNGNLLGGKSFVYEGGIRVPAIISWDKVIEAGQRSEKVAGLVDVMPTLCDLVDIRYPYSKQLAGTSLMPLIKQENFVRKKSLSWFFYRTKPEMAMRIDNYSLLASSPDTSMHTHAFTAPDMEHIKQLKLEKFELYDLAEDPSQSRDIFEEKGQYSIALQVLLEKRFKEIQKNSYVWKELPAVGNKVRKKRSEWRKLRPESFSN